jgi:hypothetical protein
MHRRTDPACRRYRPPSGPVGRWWYDVHRGRACGPCQLARARDLFRRMGVRA